ncbi:CheR family methyltransferase [Nocardioides bruguierae]|uniref:protein-glutamate O-methyltransferase n=1 Tax=Nocardioides bruguierae TaxID=2945102 RepID=A0A9X2IHN4_9ACTN|nr:protein-glutamate O-methyltransferase CheR [Nocardioides bruguierae]MCL8027654.1 protein-glutamate O-methyltransferase CheR [Nocardioides bruguierae]MCM0621985.1 protein-glutamate O-methyltransferase CheR [Nocardioides bruguierae]
MTLSPEAFRFVADLVRRESAIVLETGKEYLVDSRLRSLAVAAGDADVNAYVDRLRRPDGAREKSKVVEAMTTNETSWFRDREPFQALSGTIFQELMQRPNASRTIRIWSAACSSGQEAYTIAMLAAEHVVPLGWRVEIVATDLAQSMVDRTREGRYSQLEIGRGMPAPLLVKYFQREGTGWKVSDQLRSMVRVQTLNLAAPYPPMPVFDIVFLRNVLIYFDAATKKQVLGRVRQVLDPQGYLFLGGAETTLGIDDSWERSTIGRFTVNRPRGAVAAPTVGTAPLSGLAARKVI